MMIESCGVTHQNRYSRGRCFLPLKLTLLDSNSYNVALVVQNKKSKQITCSSHLRLYTSNSKEVDERLIFNL